jgi:hypothetical protein
MVPTLDGIQDVEVNHTALYLRAVTPSIALSTLVDFVASRPPKSGTCEILRP